MHDCILRAYCVLEKFYFVFALYKYYHNIARLIFIRLHILHIFSREDLAGSSHDLTDQRKQRLVLHIAHFIYLFIFTVTTDVFTIQIRLNH